MDEFLKMDIFFAVTTACVCIVTLLFAFILVRVLRILKNVEDISLMVEEEGEKIRKDIRNVRKAIAKEGLRASHLFDFLNLGKTGKHK